MLVLANRTSARVALCAAALLAASCSSNPGESAREIGTTASSAVPQTTTTSTTTTTTPPPTTTTLVPAIIPDGEVRAIQTSTGVVLPVIERQEDQLVIRTPCQAELVIEGGTPIERVHVVLDPGHGGFEPGAVTSDGLTEAALNLDVSRIAWAQLDRLGFEVLLTRRANHRVPIRSRVDIADAVEAELVISVHHQGTDPNVPRSLTPGSEIYHGVDDLEAKRFAGILREETLLAYAGFDIEWFAGVDAGATHRLSGATGQDFFGMVREPAAPSVLAEMSFMGNPAELDLLRTRRFRVAEATAITNAVVRWFTTEDPGSGFTEPSFTIRTSGGGGGVENCVDPELGDEITVVPPTLFPDGFGEPVETN